MLLGAPYAPAGLVQDPSAPASVSPNTAGVPQDPSVPAVVSPNTVVSSDHSVPAVPTGVSQHPSPPGGLVQDPSAPASQVSCFLNGSQVSPVHFKVQYRHTAGWKDDKFTRNSFKKKKTNELNATNTQIRYFYSQIVSLI